jgi:hypothetical protein
MRQPVHIADLIVGGILAISGLINIVAHWNHPERIRGLTYKQFMWGSTIATICGLVVALWQFVLPR